jgi:hypothetical protein
MHFPWQRFWFLPHLFLRFLCFFFAVTPTSSLIVTIAASSPPAAYPNRRRVQISKREPSIAASLL